MLDSTKLKVLKSKTKIWY